jgi:hypothetical protein
VKRGREEEDLGAFLEEKRVHEVKGLEEKPLWVQAFLKSIHGGWALVLEQGHILERRRTS